jgi:NAD(P)-dependent dehydrogenase (short-subunit alcohol dehydrogenase family)
MTGAGNSHGPLGGRTVIVTGASTGIGQTAH